MATTSGDRRTQILRQAALTFLSNGYDATSMSEIADQVTKIGLASVLREPTMGIHAAVAD